MDWSTQRYWEDISEGDEVPAISFPLSVYRLVVEAGANRDFNSIHHTPNMRAKQARPNCTPTRSFFKACGSALRANLSALGAPLSKCSAFA